MVLGFVWRQAGVRSRVDEPHRKKSRSIERSDSRHGWDADFCRHSFYVMAHVTHQRHHDRRRIVTGIWVCWALLCQPRRRILPRSSHETLHDQRGYNLVRLVVINNPRCLKLPSNKNPRYKAGDFVCVELVGDGDCAGEAVWHAVIGESADRVEGETVWVARADVASIWPAVITGHGVESACARPGYCCAFFDSQCLWTIRRGEDADRGRQ